jgi:hypothetical protein
MNKPRRTDSAAPPASLFPPESRTLGWAGWLLRVPAALRFSEVEGDGDKGWIELADGRRPRLLIRWSTLGRRSPKLEDLAVKAVRLWGAKDRPVNLAGRVRSRSDLLAGSFASITDEGAAVTVSIGIGAATRRLLEIVVRQRPDESPNIDADDLLRTLTDSAPDSGQRWAFYATSFVAVPGYAFQSAELNLGDMSVSLRDRARRAEMTVRQIYPASLALSKMHGPEWLDAMRKPPIGRALPAAISRTPGTVQIQTPLGPGWFRDDVFMKLRKPRRQRTWVINDEKADRLLVLRVRDEAARFDVILDTILSSLHWAGRPGSDEGDD